jgi:hypothetical protein
MDHRISKCLEIQCCLQQPEIAPTSVDQVVLIDTKSKIDFDVLMAAGTMPVGRNLHACSVSPFPTINYQKIALANFGLMVAQLSCKGYKFNIKAPGKGSTNDAIRARTDRTFGSTGR